MLEFVKPMRKRALPNYLEKSCSKTSQNTRGFVRSVMEPAWLFVIIHMA